MIQKILVLTFLISGIGNSLLSQEPVFFTSKENQVMLNPAFAGSSGRLRTQVTAKYDFHNIPVNPLMINISVDKEFLGRKISHGLGIELINQSFIEKFFRRTEAKIDYAFRFPVFQNKASFSGGVSAGLLSLPFTEIFTEELVSRTPQSFFSLPYYSLNGGFISGNPSFNLQEKIFFTSSFGAGLWTQSAWLSISVSSAPDPGYMHRQSKSGLVPKILFTSGYKIRMDKKNKLFLVPQIQGLIMHDDVGGIAGAELQTFRFLIGGGGGGIIHKDLFETRWVSNFHFGFGFRFLKTLTFRYAYDYTSTNLVNGISGGSQGLSLTWLFPIKCSLISNPWNQY